MLPLSVPGRSAGLFCPVWSVPGWVLGTFLKRQLARWGGVGLVQTLLAIRNSCARWLRQWLLALHQTHIHFCTCI